MVEPHPAHANSSRDCFRTVLLGPKNHRASTAEVDVAEGVMGTLERGPPISHSIIAHTALVMAPLWMSANGSYNYSLSFTSVASSTILAATSSLFTFIFAVMAKVEQFEWLKLAGVVLCIAGSVLVTLDDSSGGDSKEHTAAEMMLGDLLALASAGILIWGVSDGLVCYGLYTVALRVKVPPEHEEHTPMTLIFGYLGAFNFGIATPILGVLVLAGAVSFEGMSPLVFFALVFKVHCTTC